MGKVYRAEDPELGREVAIKVLPAEVAGVPDRLARFRREARAVAALDHPGVVTIHSVEESAGVHFLTMELVAGEPLDLVILDAGLRIERFFDIATTLAGALGAAHEKGIVHRDIKPANVMIGHDGRTKVLDFGLARFVPEGPVSEFDRTQTATAVGVVLGTPGYMAPEQAAGGVADTRSDVFSAGAVLHEMLTGQPAFRRDSAAATLAAVLREEAEPPIGSVGGVPADVARVVERCLRKEPEERFADGAELKRALDDCRRRHSDRGAAGRPAWRRPSVAMFAIAAAGALAVAMWWGVGTARERRVLDEMVPEVERLLEEQRHLEAFHVAMEARRVLPDSLAVQRVVERASSPLDVVTDPPGARVRLRPYRNLESPWLDLGETPIEDGLVPYSYLLFRIEKEGYQTAELAYPSLWGSLDLELAENERVPAGMVWIPGGTHTVGGATAIDLPGYWMDRYEVSNREFQEFVDAGGYDDPTLWPEPFEDAGRELSREEAMARFVDRTGRPGPATWEVGRYPDGDGDLPVRGVSWYEASAYARWADKALPTVSHWRHATGPGIFAEILTLSNFGGDGPAPAGRFAGLSTYGTYDMAGNVKEWCHNRRGDLRYTLGGAWDEAPYLYAEADALSPLDRSPNLGFRCTRYPEPPPAQTTAPLAATRFDFSRVEPVSDEVYEVFARQFTYEARDLDARVELVDDSATHWRRETVSFTPGYDGERMIAHLFLPRHVSPPYQAVVLRPGGAVNWLERIEDWTAQMPEFIPRGGRALVVPALYQTLERGSSPDGVVGTSTRERVERQVKDVSRTLDYLETRPDIDPTKIAYLGVSAGSEYGAIYLAVEKRFATAVLVAGGFHDEHMLDEPEEANPWHYAPRLSLPVLMINGEHDFTLPVELAQKPMFELLGTPPGDKRHVILEGGHITSNRTGMARETLAWLDRYVGEPEERYPD